ncbi:MAG: hypothetical protein D6784_06525, partial [Chloroflexi bacterium]
MKRIVVLLSIFSLAILACSPLARSREARAVSTAIASPSAEKTSVPPTATPAPRAAGVIESLPGGGVRLSTTDGLSLTLASDGQITAVSIDGDALPVAPAPPLTVRDLTQAGADDAPNLLPNPGFEAGQRGWSPLAASRVEMEVVNQTTHSGRRALEIRSQKNNGRGAIISDPIPVTPGARYRVSGYFQVEFGYVDETGTPIFWQDELYNGERMVTGLYLQWLDADGTPLDETPQLAVALHWNAQTWHKISRELTAPPEAEAVQIIAGAKPVTGAVWIDDLAWTEAVEPDQSLTGALEIGDDYVTQRGEAAGLQTAVTYRPYSDHIAVTVTLTDPAGRARAFDAAWGVTLTLPPAADAGGGGRGEGWTWRDDLRHSRPIAPGSDYANTVSADIAGYLPVSLYPYTALDDGAHGLALAQPFNSPRYVLLHYDGKNNRYEARAHLGISPEAVRLNNSADFSLQLYRFDPAWGLRAVAAKHAAINPAAYDTPADFTGYTGFTRESFRATGERAKRLRQFNEADVFAAQYTVYELPIRIADGDAPRPSFAQVRQSLDSDSVICDSAGEPHLKSIGVHPWSDNQWEATWIPNVDPDLPNGVGGPRLTRLDALFADTHAAGLRLDGVFIDNFISTSTVDTCPAHLAAADLPLTYEPDTYQPGVHTASAGWEFIVALRALLDAQPEPYRGIGVNFWSLNTAAQLMPYIDAFAGEGDSAKGMNWTPDILDYRMAMAMGRPRVFANQQSNLTAEQVETFIHEALFYGIRPGRGANAANWPDGTEKQIDRARAMVNSFMHLGWQPVTLAVTDHPDVWVERFGNRIFTVHNWGDAP